MMNSINNFIIIDDQNDFRDALKKLSLDPDPLPEKPFPEKAPTDRFVGKKSGPLYGLHSYWSKKPYDAIKSSILKFTKENDIIIDPFCGSGSTIIASALTNRRSIGLDLSPAAFHISHFFLLPLFGKSSKRSIIDNWLLKIDKQTRDIRQFTWKRADWEIESLIYSEQYRCPKCYTWRLLSNFKKAHGKNCCDTPDCGEVINTRSRKIEYGPAKIVSAELRDLKARKKTTFEVQKNEELEKILENLENNITERGGQTVNSISKNTTALIVAQKGGKLTGKAQKASTLGIPIYEKEEFINMFITS